MSGGRTALRDAPVAWRILIDSIWTNCTDPELAARAKSAGWAVEALFTREQLQAAYDEGYGRAIDMVASGE